MKSSLAFCAAFSFFALVSLSGEVRADSCPQGMITNPIGAGGQPQCIPGENHQNWGSTGSGSSGPRYARRWGAFASDSIAGKLGIASGASSKRKAEKEALKHCQSKGGVDCKAFFAFYDQCAAVAWGPDRGSDSGEAIAASAAGKDGAISDALALCGKKSDKCKLVSAECSYGELTN
ncbi:hypothetical protein ABIE09_001137 [Lysobacter enzymogenes]|uniref:DUF4189 domain-containing protein n=1 Tax=Lysobacter enzymogenes TaxID=69 RepID=UPI00339B99B2